LPDRSRLAVCFIGRTVSSQKLSQRVRLAEAGLMKASWRALLKQKDCGRISTRATDEDDHGRCCRERGADVGFGVTSSLRALDFHPLRRTANIGQMRPESSDRDERRFHNAE
jgi:hypothetical protein